jgi:hypothetical protein
MNALDKNFGMKHFASDYNPFVRRQSLLHFAVNNPV